MVSILRARFRVSRGRILDHCARVREQSGTNLIQRARGRLHSAAVHGQRTGVRGHCGTILILGTFVAEQCSSGR